MRKKTLDLLESLLNASVTREHRKTQLLKDPDVEYYEGWYMCIRKCFNEALDIKYTTITENKVPKRVKTQGTIFSFKKGDALYDTPKAYEQWSEALKHINLCVQVEKASDVTPASKNNKRFPGYVFFNILTPNQERTKLVLRDQLRMSQDEFVRFLITGPSVEMLKRINRTQLIDDILPSIQDQESVG